MPVKIEEWVQREWTQPGVDLYRQRGDFYALSGLYPDFARRLLRRAPGWSAHLTHSDLTAVRGMLFDALNTRYVLIGTNPDSYLASIYFNAAWELESAVTKLPATTNLGGLSGRNLAYWGDKFWCVGANGKVYQGPSYANFTLLTAIYTTGDASIIAPFGSRMYLATIAGDIYRSNAALDGFETHYDPPANIRPLYLTAFRDYLLMIARHAGGSIHIYRLPQTAATLTPNYIHEIASIPTATTSYPDYGCLFANHDDKIYFSPGRYTNPDGTRTIDIYTFNGSQLERIAQLPDSISTPSSAGLINWRGELVYYALTGTGPQTPKILINNQFTDLAPISAPVDQLAGPHLASLGGELVITATNAGNEGIHHAGADTLQDGYYISSRLDMEHPGRPKRLARITAILDGAAASFNVIIKYRIDDNTSWTTAATVANTRHAAADDLRIEFYTLQIRVDLDDDTGTNHDTRLEAISAIYTISD